MDIEHWRKEIDEIDAELLRLLNMRARLALKVGAIKQTLDLPCRDPERERSVLQRLQEINDGQGRGGHAVDPQEIESGEKAAEHSAGGVTAVEESPARDAGRRSFNPAHDRRQR